MAGLTGSGLQILTQGEIIAEMQESYRAKFGASINTDVRNPNSVAGREIGIYSEREALLWQLAQACYNMLDINSAGGVLLDNLAGINGLTRKPPTPTTVPVVLTGVEGTEIPVDSIVATSTGVEYRFTSALVLGAGSTAATLTARVAGAVPIAAGALDTTVDAVIVTPIVGWATCDNTVAGTTGTNRETDQELRLRIRELDTSQSTDSLVAELANLTEVQAVVVLENDTDTIDANGLPPHSFEVVLFGSGIDSQEIGELIYQYKWAGVRAHGDISVTVQDSLGNDQVVRYSTATLVSIEVNVTVETSNSSGFPVDGVTQIQDAIAATIDALTVGEDVRTFELVCAIGDIPGITDVDITTRRLSEGVFDADNEAIAAAEKAQVADQLLHIDVTET